MFKLYYEFNEDDVFTFTISLKEVREALIGMDLIEYDDSYDIDEKDYFDIYEDDIKDYYHEEAFDVYLDEIEYNKDPLKYYGMSQKDFL